MASMAQMLQTNIVINSRVGNGFANVGSTLMEMSSLVSGLSQQLIDFGKESTQVYRNYESAMRDAEVALSTTYGQGSKELAQVMANLDAAATQWAASTIFHTNDVASAISNAAHAGWNYEQIMSGLPAAMQLAQAGGIDLTTAINYVTKATTAAGVEFGDLGNFIDLWIFAANSSASTVDEFGQAMLRMGSTMQWASNPAELMTLIAATANAGTVGSEAGTLIRNSIMRLIAPTAKADKALHQLGATTLETAEVMNDEDLFAAYEMLAENGFKGVFDENGNMRNVLDIYTDLAVVLGGMAGGVDKISKNEKTMKILASIFPTKTITEAMNLINAAANGWDGLYDSMMNGEASGYGEYAATTMMNTLNGKIETFKSKLERLKQLVGDELAPKLEQAMDFMGGIVDNLANMDEDKFGALVTGLTTVAALGPGLMTAGMVMRFIGALCTPTGVFSLAVAALVAGTAAMREMQEADFKNQFGDMDFDAAGILDYIDSLGKEFTDASTEVNKYKDALDASVASYKTASSTFSAKIFEDMITGATLTDADKKELQKLGTEMYLQVKSAIANSTAGSLSYWEMLFKGDEQNPTYQALKDSTNSAYGEMIAEAEGISRDMREALTSAFNDDGTINEEEYNKFLNYMRQYNALMAKAAAQAQEEENDIEMQMMLHKAQTAGIDDVKALAEQVAEKRDAIIAEEEENFWREYYRAKNNGATQEELDAAEAKWNARKAEIASIYDAVISAMFLSTIQQSEQGDALNWLSDLATQVENGLSTDEALKMVVAKLGKSVYAGDAFTNSTTSDRAVLGRALGYWVANMGGEDAVETKIADYEAKAADYKSQAGRARDAGNSARADELQKSADEMQASADRMRHMYAMEQLANGFYAVARYGKEGDLLNWIAGDFSTMYDKEVSVNIGGKSNQRQSAENLIQATTGDYTLDMARKQIELLGEGEGTIQELMSVIGNVVKNTEGYSIDDISDSWFAVAGVNFDMFTYFTEQLSKMYDLETAAKALGEDYVSGENARFSKEYGIWNLLYGEASKHPEDYLLTNQPLTTTVEVDGDTSKLEEKINQYNDRTVTLRFAGVVYSATGSGSPLSQSNVWKNRMQTIASYATGGRADEPSIFGEDGAEWAIPEEHSDRTARLLDAARAASGFTWAEILSRYGGMNANASNTPTTIVYSPTINATDATGVEQVLREDKRRFEKWLAEKQMRDSVEVYA